MNTIDENYTCLKVEVLEVKLSIGLLPEEREAPQRILIDLDLYTAPDYLEHADEASMLDYAVICKQIKELETHPHIDLIETLAQKILDMIFMHESAASARVKILKPDIIEGADGVGIEVFRVRA